MSGSESSSLVKNVGEETAMGPERVILLNPRLKSLWERVRVDSEKIRKGITESREKFKVNRKQTLLERIQQSRLESTLEEITKLRQEREEKG